MWDDIFLMPVTKRLPAILTLVLLPLFLSGPNPASGQAMAARAKTYPLNTWSNQTCRAKGRFQDREYCASAAMDQIVADGKSAIPVLISQITDSRWIAEPVYDFWPRIRTGELAHFILADLFLDDSWQKSTMPALFRPQDCDNEPSWVCWGKFRKTHSLKDIQTRWMEFWKANQDKVYWDGKARCFRLPEVAKAEAPPEVPKTQAPQPSRIRVNEEVQKAKLVHIVSAVYPPATGKRMVGTVVFHVVVDKNGAVKSARYVSGPMNLMNSAVDAVLQWRYRSTSLNGVPVEVDTTVSVVFPRPVKQETPAAIK